MIMILVMTAVCGLIGLMSFKYGVLCGYSDACDDFMQELIEADKRIEKLRAETR